MPIRLVPRAASTARGFARPAAALILALSATLLYAGPSYADVITVTETGFTGGGPLAGGTLVATFTGTETGKGDEAEYELDGLTAANVTYTVGGTLIYDYSLPDVIQFGYVPSLSRIDFEATNDPLHNVLFVSGDGFLNNGVAVDKGFINKNGATSTSPFTISVVPGSSGLGSSGPGASPVPEPSTWILLSVGAAALAFAHGKRKTGSPSAPGSRSTFERTETMPIQLFPRAASTARGLARPAAALILALSATPLSAGPSYADVITMTETGFTGGGVLAGGTLVGTFTGTEKGEGKDAEYDLDSLTDGSVTYTVGDTLIYSYTLADISAFVFVPGYSRFSFEATTTIGSDVYIEGVGYLNNGTEVGEGYINKNGATSTSPFTISIVPGSSGLGSPSPVPEPSTWILLGVGVAAIALACGRRTNGAALLRGAKGGRRTVAG